VLLSYKPQWALGSIVDGLWKEIGIWAKSLFGASEALKELTQAQKILHWLKLAVEKTQTDIIELRKYLAVVKDEKVSMEERNIALKR
jgi:hypothetical protein